MVLNFFILVNLGYLLVDFNYFKICYVFCFIIFNLLFYFYLIVKLYVFVLVGVKFC